MKTLKFIAVLCVASLNIFSQALNNNTGLSGGTALIGGLNASEDLNLTSTSHGTKGLVTIGSNAFANFNETTNQFGIGRTPITPAIADFYDNYPGSKGIYVTNASNANTAAAMINTSNDQQEGLTLYSFGSQYSAYGASDFVKANNSSLYSTASNLTAIVNTQNVPFVFTIGGHSYSSEVMRIQGNGMGNGQVGINQASPSYPLDVSASGSGAIAINAYGLIYSNGGMLTSDMRFKRQVKKLENITSKLSRISGYSYFFNSEEFPERNFATDQQLGLIAQEVRDVFPQLVGTDHKGFLAVNYQGMVPVLLEGMKEQQVMIEKLQAQVKTLEAKTSGVSGIANVVTDEQFISQNEPNPFTHETVIKYNLPATTQTAYLAVYDLTGKQVTTFQLQDLKSTSITITSEKLAAGIYIYSIIADGKASDSKRMIVADK